MTSARKRTDIEQKIRRSVRAALRQMIERHGPITLENMDAAVTEVWARLKHRREYLREAKETW